MHFYEPNNNLLNRKFQYVYEYFSSMEAAQLEAKKGNLVGIMHFSETFTNALLTRMADGKETPPDVLDDSQVSIWLDMSGTSFILPNTDGYNLNL